MGGLRGSPQVVVGKINQSKSVPMMSLNVVGNINQSNSRCLHGSLQVVSTGLHGWSPWVSAGGLRGSPQVVVGKIIQSKSVPMMSLNVVGNINQSNSRCLCRPPWVSAGDLCGFPWVSVGGLHRSLWVVVGKINQSKSVPMMSLNVVGNINQSNSICLCGSLWVVSAGLYGLHGWFCGFLQVSTGLCG